jgi:hypothetical protein
MISYELARELRDAGYNFKNSPTMYNDEIGCPTLEELIEACGKSRGFFLLQEAIVKGEKLWQAKVFGSNIGFSNGSTPLIAAARLWIALNTNS